MGGRVIGWGAAGLIRGSRRDGNKVIQRGKEGRRGERREGRAGCVLREYLDGLREILMAVEIKFDL